MEPVQRHIHISRKAKKLLFIIIPVIAVLCVALLVWRPWYAPQPYSSLPPDPWIHIVYAHAELQESQKLADSGKRPDLLDPRKTLTSFLTTNTVEGDSFDLRPQFSNLDIAHVQSIQDYGKDPKNGDQLFLVTFPQQHTFVFFRLRQLLGIGPTKIWSVIGYLITAYSSSWQESDGPFISGQ